MSRIIKNRSNVANLKSIPTWKLKEIIDSPNGTGIDGADYGPVMEELMDIYLERISSNATKLIERTYKELLMQTVAGNLPPAMPDECYEEMFA